MTRVELADRICRDLQEEFPEIERKLLNKVVSRTLARVGPHITDALLEGIEVVWRGLGRFGVKSDSGLVFGKPYQTRLVRFKASTGMAEAIKRGA